MLDCRPQEGDRRTERRLAWVLRLMSVDMGSLTLVGQVDGCVIRRPTIDATTAPGPQGRGLFLVLEQT